ncbi:MAG: hypothetical protein AB1486_31985, partial [Planctomycetota bacterium]
LSPQDPSLPAQGLEVTEEGIRIVTAGTFGELMEKFIGGLRENLPAEALHQIGLGDLTATGAGGFDSLPAETQELLAGLLIEANDFLLSGASGYSISALGRLRLTNGMHWAAAFLNREAGSFSFWEGAQLALDALALSEVPFASQAAGFASAAIDLGRGDWGWGLTGLAGTIPFLGSASDAARVGRAARRAAKTAPTLLSRTSTGPRASAALLQAIQRHGRTIDIATPGSEELRYLEAMGAEANVGGPTHLHILLREDPSKAAALEEFLHGTQSRLGIIERLGVQGAEAHVKSFMERHKKLLGLE